MGCTASNEAGDTAEDSLSDLAPLSPVVAPQATIPQAQAKGKLAPHLSAGASSTSLRWETPRQWSRAHSLGLVPHGAGARPPAPLCGSTVQVADVRKRRAAMGPESTTTPNPAELPGGTQVNTRAEPQSSAHLPLSMPLSRSSGARGVAAAMPVTGATRPSPSTPTPIAFKLGNVLARGATGLVYLALNQDSGSLMVAKALDLETSTVDVKALFHEVRMLRELQHPNIVSYIGTQVHDNVAFIFTDWVSGGSLRSLLKKFGPLEPDLVRRYARDILQGLRHLHDSHVVHGDIKPGNLLVDSCGTVKVADFGAARRVRPGVPALERGTKIAGTPRYMSPELVRGQCSDDRASDVWALGCTLLELASGQAPWSQLGIRGTAGLMRHIAQARTSPPVPHGLPAGLYDILAACFCIDPVARVTVHELLAHPWLSPALTDDWGDSPRAEHSQAVTSARAPALPPVLEAPLPPDTDTSEPPAPRLTRAEGPRPPPIPTARAASPSVGTNVDDERGYQRASPRPGSGTPLLRHASAVDVSRHPVPRPARLMEHRGSLTEPEDEGDGCGSEAFDVFCDNASEGSRCLDTDGGVVVNVQEVVGGTGGPACPPSLCLSNVMPSHLSGAPTLGATTLTTTTFDAVPPSAVGSGRGAAAT